MRAGSCTLHVGTHRTGTTTIQTALVQNEALLARHGLLVPRTGRYVDASPGHHNVAWELTGDPRFDPARGDLDALVRELSASDAPRACVSSEDLEYLHVDRPGLDKLAGAIRDGGYTPHVVLYLRPQLYLARSLYGELRKHGLRRTPFECLDEILATGQLTHAGGRWIFCFDYPRLIAPFVDVFGHDRVAVRAYPERGDDDALLNDFFTLAAGRDETLLRALRRPPRRNATATAPRDLPFRGAAEKLAIAVRFAKSMDEVARRYGETIRPVALAEFAETFRIL